jgi:hypothetical protein
MFANLTFSVLSTFVALGSLTAVPHPAPAAAPAAHSETRPARTAMSRIYPDLDMLQTEEATCAAGNIATSTANTKKDTPLAATASPVQTLPAN